jgi:hypothetical protein
MSGRVSSDFILVSSLHEKIAFSHSLVAFSKQVRRVQGERLLFDVPENR